jgi:hypothetical protein
MPKHDARNKPKTATPRHLAPVEEAATETEVDARTETNATAKAMRPKPRLSRESAPFVLGGILLVVGGLLFALTALLIDRPGRGFGSGSLGLAIEAKPAPPTARELIDQSPLSRTLLASPDEPAPELAHEPSYRHVLDDEILNDTQAFANLADAIAALEAKKYTLGIVVEDIENGATFAYNADEEFYSASSIKGPYVACLYETLAETDETKLRELNRLARPTIEDSNNETYAELRRRYGSEQFEAWLQELDYGIDEYDSLSATGGHYYLHLNAWQLSAMWERIYGYLTSETEAAETLAGYFERRDYSAIKEALGEDVRTWGKGGWYPSSDGYASPVTVDAGIVWADHPYLVVVMSDIPGEMEKLEPVVAALDELHEGLTLIGTGEEVPAGLRLQPAAQG